MGRFIATLALAAGAFWMASPSRSVAASTCGSMLMPAVQLKQVSRGFARVGGHFHSGLDLTAPYGSPVRAAASGQVIFVGRWYGYGDMVDLKHDDGTVTRYAHLSAYGSQTRVGAVMRVGDVIGRVGTSGTAHGSHLLFEVRIDGKPVDPKPYLSLAACSVPDADGGVAEAPISAPEPPSAE